MKELEEFSNAVDEFKNEVIKALKIEEVVKWLTKLINKNKQNE